LLVHQYGPAATRAIEQQLREVDPKTDFKRYRMLTSMQVRESGVAGARACSGQRQL
jgi:hypothetical protein